MNATASRSPFALFFKEFLKHPAMVASMIPSSDKGMERILEKCKWSKANLFVEYGPGIGNFCEPVLKKLPPNATYIAIDTNEEFVGYLKDTIHDERFHAVVGSAADVEDIIKQHGFDKADYVLSGLPFSNLPQGVGDEIGVATQKVLRPGGCFIVYQFTTNCLEHIKPNFNKIEQDRVYWNMPPLHLFWAYKE